MNKKYTCENCHKTFEEGWTNEEAEAEMHYEFGIAFETSDCAIVCDDCYGKIMKQI